MYIPVHDSRYQFSDCLRLTRIQTCVQWPPRMVWWYMLLASSRRLINSWRHLAYSRDNCMCVCVCACVCVSWLAHFYIRTSGAICQLLNS